MEEEFEDIDGKNAWGAVYQDIRNKSNNYNYTFKDARKIENKILNRYRDVNPYDHSRIRLQRGEKDYINASLVNVASANRSYILTQGPLPATTGHFWLMIWEQKSKAILMLNRVIEKNTVKCHQYWPTGSKNGGKDEMVLTDVGLKVDYVNEREASNYTVRELLLTDSQSGQSRIVLQFHYTTWPDFGVPGSPAAFLSFLFAVRDSGVLSSNVGPPVVHCSAGIGRSGTFCLVDSCLVLIQKKGDVNAVKVQELLLEMRRYRMGLIQTPDQLRFSYQAIIEGAKKILADNSMPLNTVEDGPVLESLETPSVEDNENLQGYHASEEDISASLITEDSDMETSPPPLPPRSFRRSEDLSPTSLKLTSNMNSESEIECHKDSSNNSSSELVDIENRNHEQVKSKFTKFPNSSANLANCETSSASDSNRVNDKNLHLSNSKDCAETETTGDAVSPSSVEAESASELRKRKRKERLEKTAALVQSIKKKQRESETRSRRRLKQPNAKNSRKMQRK